MPDLYALDFDGILCDSCGESSLSALKAAKLRWPSLFGEVTPSLESKVLDDMRAVRPVVETGYENLLLVRLLLEMYLPSIRVSKASSSEEGVSVSGILSAWERLKPEVMRDWGEEDRDALVHCFGSLRDSWIAHDLHGWTAANRFYPGTADALRFATSPVFIVTTKQTRFAQVLLHDLAGVDFPSDRIYGLGSGPKVEVLKELQLRPEYEGYTLHFVEDRLATLKNVIKDPALAQWQLYLGNWGYNTTLERAGAESIARVNVIDLPQFCSKLK